MDAMNETAIRLIGFCQICEGEHKLTVDRKVVHHGYQRPGYGHIVGDCYGVGAEPYELSRDRLALYRASVESNLRDEEEWLRKLSSGEVEEVRVERGYGRTARTEILKRGEVGFEYEISNKKAAASYRIRSLKDELKRVVARFDGWTLKPVRTVEEKVAEERAKKERSAAERAEKRAARDAKEAAKAEKRESLKARREAILAGFRAEFVALAAEPKSDERTKKVLAVATKVMAKKHQNWLYVADLGVDDALLALGLATVVPQGGNLGDWMRYNFPLAGGHRA